MNMRKLFLAGMVGLGAMATTASAVPIITTSMELYDISGTTAPTLITPTSPGVYNLTQGQQFRVMVKATMTSPNSSDANHTDSNDDPIAAITLGISNLAVQLTSSGSNIVQPTTPTGSNAGKWARDGVGVSNTVAQKFAQGVTTVDTNLNDLGADGDLDPDGMGYAQLSLVYGGVGVGQNSGQITGLSNGLLTPSFSVPSVVNVSRGAYTASNNGTSVLTAFIADGKGFIDPAAADNSLAVQNATLANGTITINVGPVPEPASLSVLALGGLGMLARRRRA